MENRLLAYLYGEISKISDFEMTPGEKLAEHMSDGVEKTVPWVMAYPSSMGFFNSSLMGSSLLRAHII